MRDAGCGMQDAGCGMQDAGCGMQDAGFIVFSRFYKDLKRGRSYNISGLQ